MRRLLRLSFAIFALALALPAALGAAEVDFARDVYPILQRSCFECHTADKHKGGLRLDDREAAMKGSMNGLVIVPGHSESSKLYAIHTDGWDPWITLNIFEELFQRQFESDSENFEGA